MAYLHKSLAGQFRYRVCFESSLEQGSTDHQVRGPTGPKFEIISVLVRASLSRTIIEQLGVGPIGFSPWIPDCTSVTYFDFKRVAGWQP